MESMGDPDSPYDLFSFSKHGSGDWVSGGKKAAVNPFHAENFVAEVVSFWGANVKRHGKNLWLFCNKPLNLTTYSMCVRTCGCHVEAEIRTHGHVKKPHSICICA